MESEMNVTKKNRITGTAHVHKFLGTNKNRKKDPVWCCVCLSWIFSFLCLFPVSYDFSDSVESKGQTTNNNKLSSFNSFSALPTLLQTSILFLLLGSYSSYPFLHSGKVGFFSLFFFYFHGFFLLLLPKSYSEGMHIVIHERCQCGT